jgi:hypothetical protein
MTTRSSTSNNNINNTTQDSSSADDSSTTLSTAGHVASERVRQAKRDEKKRRRLSQRVKKAERARVAQSINAFFDRFRLVRRINWRTDGAELFVAGVALACIILAFFWLLPAAAAAVTLSSF